MAMPRQPGCSCGSQTPQPPPATESTAPSHPNTQERPDDRLREKGSSPAPPAGPEQSKPSHPTPPRSRPGQSRAPGQYGRRAPGPEQIVRPKRLRFLDPTHVCPAPHESLADPLPTALVATKQL